MTQVGILTFHHTLNYGASLQCYALQQVLTDLGCEASVIDYRNETVEASECQRWSAKDPASVAKYLMKTKKRRAFDRFARRLALTRTCDRESIADVARNFDCIVVGSDQVWNTQITGSDMTYFLPFETDPHRCKSYAPSIGKERLPADEPYATHLSGFSSLLVREQSAAQELRRLLPSHDDISLVCDPTLLLSRERWMDVARLPKCAQGKDYILVYAVSEFDLTTRLATKIAAQEGLEVIQIQQRRKGKVKGATHLRSASPEEFVGLVAHAHTCVVSSYHGLCFSLVFGRDVLCTASDSRAGVARFGGLVDRLGISDRIVDSLERADEAGPIDHTEIRRRLEALAESSRTTLARSLELN